MSTLKRPAVFIPLLLGVALRVFLLAMSWNNGGYTMGDTYFYVEQSRELMRGVVSPNNYFYTPGFSLYLGPFLAAFNDLRAVCIANILIFVAFTLYIFRLLEVRGGRAILSVWFLSLDPIWIVQTLSQGADFFGAVLFGMVFFNLALGCLEKGTWSRWAIFGLVMAWAIFTKPVYLYTPLFLTVLSSGSLLCAKDKWLVFHLIWLIPVSLWIGARGMASGVYSFSGHSSGMFGSYIVGYRLISENQASGTEDSFKKANEAFQLRRQADPEFTWRAFIIENVKERPVLYAKLFVVSVYKTIFGHTNVLWARFFTGTDMEGPGLWKQFAGDQSLFEKLKSISWPWILGLALVFLEKVTLVFLASKGLLKLWKQKRYALAGGCVLLVLYFALSPVVFGDPKYFLPGTLVLLFLA